MIFTYSLLIFDSIGCALAMKIGGEAKAHEISKTQKSFGEIPPGWRDIKIINIFNEVPNSKLRKIKILMFMGEKVLNNEDQIRSNLSH